MDLSLPLPRGAAHGRSARRVPLSPLDRVRALLLGGRVAMRVAVMTLLALALLGGGWLWLRDSSLAAIEQVHVTGVRGPQAAEIRAALGGAARRMTTMDFNVAALRSAVASFAAVQQVSATTSFPHAVAIDVRERAAVAELVTQSGRTAVAADGTVLGSAWLSDSLPQIQASVEPPPGARVADARVRADVSVLGAAPAVLAGHVARVYNGPEGLTVAMRNGLLVYFGDASRPHAKWLSLATVLASPSATGAWYVDVRLPERPAAGLSSGSASSSTPVTTGPSDPTAAALAATLSQAVRGGGEPTPASGEESSSGAPQGTSSTSAATSTTTSESPSGSASGAAAEAAPEPASAPYPGG